MRSIGNSRTATITAALALSCALVSPAFADEAPVAEQTVVQPSVAVTPSA
jgi:hypothetical protein